MPFRHFLRSTFVTNAKTAFVTLRRDDRVNRILEFETVLERSWTEFKTEIIVGMSKLRREVHLLRRIVRGQDIFEERDSVVLLKERKVGKVTFVTDKFVDIVMDYDQKKIRKTKTLVMKLAETQG